MDPSGQGSWFSVRCVIRNGTDADDAVFYEERITLWSCASAEAAVRSALNEANEYSEQIGDAEALDFAQVFELADDPGSSGVEVFSLIRASELGPAAYLDHFFDNGEERQRSL